MNTLLHLFSFSPLLAVAAVDDWILAFSAITVFATIWMGFRSARTSKTASDFFVAGRSVSVGWNASAISGEYLSAASFMGIAGMVMSSGYDALWYPVCYACGYLFLLLFIAGPLRRFGAYTIPDFAEGRFDSPVFRKIAVIFVLFIGFFYTMPQMKGAGTTLAYIFPGLPYWAGVVLVGAVITLNVALGGMKGITLVQAFQYWLKMFAISVPIFVLMAVYGHYGKQVGANGIERPLQVENGESIVSIVEARKASSQVVLSNFGMTAEGRAVQLVEQEGSGFLRAPLPPKAPDDATWLNPFGPLTTKAAKNAAPILGRPSTPASDLTPLASPDATMLQHADALRSGATNISSPFPANTLVGVNKALARVTELFGVDTYRAPSLPGTITGANATQPLDYQSGMLFVQQIFSAHGIKLLVRSNSLYAVPAASADVYERKLDEVKPPSQSEITAAQTAWLDKHEKPLALLYTYSLIIAIVCGTAGLPHILVRFYTNPDGTAAKRTTMWVMILIGVFYVFPPVFGVMGRNLLPSLYTGTGAKGTDKVVLELPRVVSARSVPASDTNAVEQLLPYSPSAEARGLTPVPLPQAPPPKPGIPWGSILSGITCAGAFAAFMSTFSGLLVSMTGALAHDVYGRILRPKATAEQRLRMFKISAVLIGGVAIALGSFVEPLQINFMVGQAFAIAAASYFPLLFMSVWWRGMTMKGAAAGMLTGGICALGAVTITNFSDLKWLNLSRFWAEHPLLRILCEQPAIWTVPLAIALMVVVSKLTQREVPGDSRMKMLVLHAPEQLGLKQEYIQEHQAH